MAAIRFVVSALGTLLGAFVFLFIIPMLLYEDFGIWPFVIYWVIVGGLAIGGLGQFIRELLERRGMRKGAAVATVVTYGAVTPYVIAGAIAGVFLVIGTLSILTGAADPSPAAPPFP